MSSATNRAITLAGANKIFSGIGIEIKQDPLGFYESFGPISLRSPTLTELCQNLVKALADRK